MSDTLPITIIAELRALEAINTTVNNYGTSLRILGSLADAEARWLACGWRQDKRAQRRRLMFLQVAMHGRRRAASH